MGGRTSYFVLYKKNMSIIYLLIGVSILVASCFLGAFLWAVKNGQYEDADTPAIRMLLEDQRKDKNKNKR